MVSALVHGNELCGAWALKDLLASGLRPRRGSLTLAFCNLDAFDRFDAANHDDSRFVQEDMQRVWSAERLNNPTTPDRQRGAALRPWVRRADWLLDLHSITCCGAVRRRASAILRGNTPVNSSGAPGSCIECRSSSQSARRTHGSSAAPRWRSGV
ncbi:succinylglutamate desuccinylase/aspartoacylase family protein, partial [Paenibacillus polymyxa]|nr:succinylglutamate desuccinylase/aspartoacylase family protein [Paenibacillus polymyxa]